MSNMTFLLRLNALSESGQRLGKPQQIKSNQIVTMSYGLKPMARRKANQREETRPDNTANYSSK